MRLYGIAFGFGALAFVLAGYQAGLFLPGQAKEATEAVVPVEEKKIEPRAKFPEDLAPSARGDAVAQAASLNDSADRHRLVFLKSTGLLHAWQESLDEDWAAGTVEQTELVVVLGPHKRTLLSVQHYPNKAPSVYRYQFEVEASVVEAKTGKVLANRQFINVPRPIKQIESWELTALGQPVDFNTVFNWVVSAARQRFPAEMNPAPPLTTVIR